MTQTMQENCPFQKVFRNIARPSAFSEQHQKAGSGPRNKDKTDLLNLKQAHIHTNYHSVLSTMAIHYNQEYSNL